MLILQATRITKQPVETKRDLRLSPIGDSYGHLNLKWVARDPKSSSNRVPIWETYFGLLERHNPNIGILSSRNPFTEMILF